VKPASGLEDILCPLGEILEEEAATDKEPDLEVDPLTTDFTLRNVRQGGESGSDSETLPQNSNESAVPLKAPYSESATEYSPEEPSRSISELAEECRLDRNPPPSVRWNPQRTRKQRDRLSYR